MTADEHKIAFDHAWKWFELHAGQRMQLFRFYIILIGICLAGYATARKEEIWICVFLLPVFGSIVTVCFAALDIRTRGLIKDAESALKGLQSETAAFTRDTSFTFVEKSNDVSSCNLTYTKCFRIMKIFAHLMFGAILLYEIISKQTHLKLF